MPARTYVRGVRGPPAALLVAIALLAGAAPGGAATAAGGLGQLTTEASLSSSGQERRLALVARGIVAEAAEPASGLGAAAILMAWSDGRTLEPCPPDPAAFSSRPDATPISWRGADAVELEVGPFFATGGQRVGGGPVARRVCTYVTPTPAAGLQGPALAAQDAVTAGARPLPRCGRRAAVGLLGEAASLIDRKWSYDLRPGELRVGRVRCLQLVAGGGREMVVGYRRRGPAGCVAAAPWVIFRASAAGWRIGLVRIKTGSWSLTTLGLRRGRRGIVEPAPRFDIQDQDPCAPSGFDRRLVLWGGASWVVRTIAPAPGG